MNNKNIIFLLLIGTMPQTKSAIRKKLNRRKPETTIETQKRFPLSEKLYSEQATNSIIQKVPIVYSPEYNISFLGMEKLHHFDTGKYGKVAKTLEKKLNIKFKKPKMPSQESFLRVHDEEYLNSLNKSKNIAEIAEIGVLKYVPNGVLQRLLLNRMKMAVGGTILAVELALDKGWAINLGGGFHHARSYDGGGFCFFNDVAIALKEIEIKEDRLIKTLIIDLDAHQGDGNTEIFLENENVFVFDIYNNDVFPNEEYKVISDKDFQFPVIGEEIDRSNYIELLRKNLNRIIKKVNPELIIYNAGTDIYEKDPLGDMAVTAKGIISRDELVFRAAVNKGIPIAMLLSGGYHPDSSKIISNSILNLFEKKIINY